MLSKIKQKYETKLRGLVVMEIINQFTVLTSSKMTGPWVILVG